MTLDRFPPFLYRGVSKDLFVRLDGKLMPKRPGVKFASTAGCGDPHAQCGSGIQCGEGVINTLILHHWMQEGHATSGVSTTPLIERAVFYALSAPDGSGNGKGYIYKLSVAELNKLEVAIYSVNEMCPVPSVVEDDEHVLVAKDFREIPSCCVADLWMVERVGT